jgi:linoleoyl-CoA desaturase
MVNTIQFNRKSNQFYQSVKCDVDAYFDSNHLKSTGNFFLYLKTIVLISAAIACYIWLVFFTPSLIWGVLGSLSFGFILACIGFNVMHDACHGSYSSKKWVNEILSLSLNLLGGNAFIWKIKHNLIHHTYPNVDGIDDDIAKAPLIRQCPSQPKFKAHKYQHIYSVLIYALSSFLWIFLMDMIKYFKQVVYTTPIKKMELHEHFIFWLTKICYVFFYLLVPIYVAGTQAIAGFFLMHIAMGLSLAVVFQLAHVVESTEFVDGFNVRAVEDEWAVHQLKTTANFAVGNKIITWLVGGLNFQIEHHLFPRISHIHYPAIHSIIESNCIKFNVPYNKFDTLGEAVYSHFKFMKELGR